MAIKRPIPRAEGVSETLNDEVLFSSQSIIMKSGKTLQEEWDEHIRDFEELKENLGSVKEFVGDYIPIPYQAKKLYYSPGVYQEPLWKGYNSQFMTMSGTTMGINADKYDVTFKFTEPDKYTWADGTNGEQPVSWYIDRQSFAVDPTQKKPYPEYDGSLKSPVWENQTDLELEVTGGDSEISGAGMHDIYLTPKSNYAWHDGSYGERKFTWQITRKKISLPVQVGVLYYEEGKVRRPTWDENGKTTLVSVVGGDAEGIEAKTYDIWFKPTDNAMWQDGSTDMKKAIWTISAAALTGDVTGPDGKMSDISLTFDGTNLKPDFQNYDPLYIDAVDISLDINGNIVKNKTITHRDVGSYTTEFTPNSNSTWKNGSNNPIRITWEIKPMPVKVPSIKYEDKTSDIKIPYSGIAVGPTLVDHDTTWVTVESATGVQVKEYTTKFTLKEANNTYWEGGGTIAKTYVWNIVPRLVKVPKLLESVVPYNNGALVSPTIEPYDTNLIKVSDNTAYNVGDNYQVKFELVDPESSAWDDDTQSTGPKYADWSVAPLSVTPPTVTGNLFTYNGQEQGPTISEYDTQQISVTGALKTDVDKYDLVLHLLKRGAVWTDTQNSTDKTFHWEIQTKKIQVPTVSNTESKTFTGENQYVIVIGKDGDKAFSINNGTTPKDGYAGTYLTVTGASGKIAQSYEVIMDLVDKKNTEWETGTTDPQTVPWKILKKSFNTPTVTGTYPFNNTEQTCQFIGFFKDYMTVTGDKATLVGPHTAVFTLKDLYNLKWSDTAEGALPESKEVVWNITAVGIDPASLSIHDADVTYDGKEHQVTAANITGFSDNLFRLDGDLKKTAAGKYKAKVYLKDTTINEWTGGKPSADPVELVWNISTRVLSIPTIKNPNTIFEYDGNEKTVTSNHCTFAVAEDKDFIELKNNTGTDADTYTLYFAIKTDHKNSCVWTGNIKTDQPADWKINKTYLKTWSISNSAPYITGNPGSYVDIEVNRAGNGTIKVANYDSSLISAEVMNSNGTTPKVRFTDIGHIGNTTAIISVNEGNNHYSSNDSSIQHSTCKSLWSCQVNVLTKCDPEDLTPAQIADIVKKGYGPSMWEVGTIIPVEFKKFRLSGFGTDYIPAGKYGAVILGYDHNKDYEAPEAAHTMTLAVMKYWQSNSGVYVSGWKKGKTTIAFIDRYETCTAEKLNEGQYDYNIFQGLVDSWKGVVIKVQKGVGNKSTVFQLASKEVYGNGGISGGDDNISVQYDYFKNNSIRYENIYPICNTVFPTTTVRVIGRTKASNTAVPLLNSVGSLYTLDDKKFTTYSEDYLSSFGTYYEYIGVQHCMVGSIPCFVIGG